MQHIASMWVPHLLMKQQLQHYVDIYTRLNNKCQNDLLFVSHVVTCDETWAYHHYPKTKQESVPWRTPQLQP